MKFKTTLVLFAVFAGLLGVVLFFESRGAKKEAAKETADTLISLASGDIARVSLVRDGETLAFERDDAGPWRLTAPLQAAADDYEVGILVDALSSLRIERVVEEEAADPAAYGIPKTEVSLWVKGKDAPVRLLVGMENPLDKSLYAKREDDPRIVLLASTLKTALEKRVFDFRDKSVFRFTPADVQAVEVRAKDVSWRASREEPGWLLKAPVSALADKGKVDSLLDSLSGLKALAFVAESKTPGSLKEFGLDKPACEVALSLPTANQEIVFALARKGEARYATSSLSTKIVTFEGTLLEDLGRKVDEMRERKPADFYAWDARRVSVKRDGAEIVAVKEKAGDGDKWILDPATREEADRTKVEDFVRKLEGLEAAAFVDGPGPLADHGLAPGTEIRILTKDYQDKEKETVLYVGKEDAGKKQAVVKNALYDYLFVVDSAFLQDLPKGKKDWAPEPPKAEEGKTDKK